MEMKQIKIDATLEGLAPVVFDKFFGHSKEELPPERKLYLREDGVVGMPAGNFWSFLVREKPAGAIKRTETQKCGEYIAVTQSHMNFRKATFFPFLDEDGQEIEFTGFNSDRWQILLESTVTKASNGSVIKQPAQPRPMLKLPWSMKLTIGLWESDINTKVTSDKLRSWFERGGFLVGIGNYRPIHGRFLVKDWDVVE